MAVWLMVNGEGVTYGSAEEGLQALGRLLGHRRAQGWTVEPPDFPPQFELQYRVTERDNGFEIIYLTHEQPEPQDA